VYRVAWLLLMALVLVGCANHSLDCSLGIWHDDCAPGTRAYDQKRADDVEAKATDAANDAKDDAECRTYGFRPDTPSHYQCRKRLADQRSYEQTSDRSAVAGRLLGRMPD
jgi:hypothetical protein